MMMRHMMNRNNVPKGPRPQQVKGVTVADAQLRQRKMQLLSANRRLLGKRLTKASPNPFPNQP